MNVLIGYFGALCIGLILGITGGGGSIITVPLLVYVLGYNPVIATAYSLFIVGTTASIGSIRNLKKGLIQGQTVLLFAIPSVISVFFTRKLIIPNLPAKLFSIGEFSLTKENFLMLLFALFMMLASYSMLKAKNPEKTNPDKNISKGTVIVQMLIIGTLVGLIGAGGGFLFIPSLINIAKLTMKKAIGTSLLIISMISLIGFAGDLQHTKVQWDFLLMFTGISILGIFAGLHIQTYINERFLKKIFGSLVLIMSVVIFIKELT